MENPIKMDDLGVPLFLETPTCWETQTHATFPPTLCRPKNSRFSQVNVHLASAGETEFPNGPEVLAENLLHV